MSGTSDVGLLPRTYFKMPRVPFDFRAVALAIVGYVVYWGGGWLISKIGTGNKLDIPGAFLAWFSDQFRGLDIIHEPLRGFLHGVFGLDRQPATTMEILVGGLWFFAVWSFFGQAIRRIVALRIARDEGLSLREALGFAARNWVTVLLAPAIVAVAAGLFWGANWLAGLVISIPAVGQLLAIVLVPLAVLSTLLMLLIVLGGVMGFPLVGAAAAWEKNGSLDAISRAFTYVFARPLQYFLNYFLIFAFTGIILYVGNWFIFALTKTVDSGMLLSDEASVLIDAPRPSGAGSNDDWSKLSEAAKEKARIYQEKTQYSGHAVAGAAGDRETANNPFALNFKTVANTAVWHWITAFMFWAFLNLIWFGVFGYAVFWFLGASCCLYADLRYDVDGTEEDEIHTDEDDAPPLAGEGAAAPAAPPAEGLPGGAAPAGGAPSATPPSPPPAS